MARREIEERDAAAHGAPRAAPVIDMIPLNACMSAS